MTDQLDRQLSPHFTLAEMTATTHRRYLTENATPPASVIASLARLCEQLLEPLREHFDKPIFVHSGYRCHGLNAAIGGSTTSQHMRGEAADLHVASVPLEEAWRWAWDAELPISQAILEGWTVGRPTWLHLGLWTPNWKKKRQLMTFSAGRYSVVDER